MEAKQERTMAMLCHLLGFFSFIGPLVIWLIKKDESALVDKNGKEALNFQISIAIYTVGLCVLAGVTFGLAGILLPALIVFNYIMLIVAAIKTNEGKDYQYPLCIRLIK